MAALRPELAPDSLRRRWEESGALAVERGLWRLRCASTFAGTRWTDFTRDLRAAVLAGLLEGAEHVEVALGTLGELWTAGAVMAALAAKPSPTVRTISLGALLSTPDMDRLSGAWPDVERAFPSLEHGPEACWRAATKPRVTITAVGPHFASFRVGQSFPLQADGSGPFLSLKAPGPGQSPFDVPSLRAHVSPENVTEISAEPLEPGDVVQVNGRPVPLHPLVVHRDGQRITRATLRWLPVAGDVVQVGGLALRYEEELAAQRTPYAQREVAAAVLMNGPSSRITVELSSPTVAPLPEDDDE